MDLILQREEFRRTEDLKLCIREVEIDFSCGNNSAYHGEKIVIRILDRACAEKSMAELGFDRKYYEKLFDILKRKTE